MVPSTRVSKCPSFPARNFHPGFEIYPHQEACLPACYKIYLQQEDFPIFQVLGGISPLSSFNSSFKIFSFHNLEMDLGIEPLKLLWEMLLHKKKDNKYIHNIYIGI